MSKREDEICADMDAHGCCAQDDIGYLLRRVLELEKEAVYHFDAMHAAGNDIRRLKTDNAKLNKRVEYLQEELGPIGGPDGRGDKKER